MKRKLVAIFILCVVFCASLFGLTACNKTEHVHVYNQRVTSETYLESGATCFQKAKYYFSCECGDVGSVTFEHGEFAPHVFKNYQYNNDAKCEINGTETAICEQNGCGKAHTRNVFDSSLEHIFKDYQYNNDAKCEVDGTETAICDRANCNEEHTRTKENSAIKHDWSAWTSNGNDTHTRICSNNSEHIEIEDCSGGTATCTELATCTACFEEYGTLNIYHLQYSVNNDGASCSIISLCPCETNTITIPEYIDGYKVTNIAERAFYFSSLVNITIPYTVTTISDRAFDGCKALTKINYTGTINQWVEMGFVISAQYNLYLNNKLLTEVILTTATKINDCAFYNCSSIVSVAIHDSVTSIGVRAFYNCSSLESVTIGDNVSFIGWGAFAGCNQLQKIEVPCSVTSIGKGAFLGCNSLEKINYLGTIDQWVGIEFDGEILSATCNLFMSDNLVKYVNLTTKTINKYSFSNCSTVESITILDGTTVISDYTFSGCSSLKKITIPESITYIGEGAFLGCSSLSDIFIYDNVSFIGNLAFKGCSSLNYNEKAGVKYLGNENNKYLYLVGVASTNLTSINIENDCKFIGDWALVNCNSLTNILIPNSVKSIGYQAFYGCSSLKSIIIPRSVRFIGGLAFYKCSSLETIYCEIECEYEGWSGTFGSWNNMCDAEVIWGYDGE